MRLHVACVVVLALAGGCATSSSGPGATSGPPPSLVETTEATAAPTTTTAPAPTIPPEGELPIRLVGSSIGGESYVLASRSGDQWIVSQTLPSPGGKVAAVVVSSDMVAVSTCCEPASGIRWLGPLGGDLSEIGFGATTDSLAGAFVSVDPNGGAVRVEGSAGRSHTLISAVSTSGNWPMPIDAALGFAGVATIGTGVDEAGIGASAVYWTGLESPEFNRAAPLVTITQDVGHYGAILVDRTSRIWVLVYPADATVATRRLVIDPSSGVVDQYTLTEPLVDQSIDETGTYVVSVLADGRVAWQRFDAATETFLDLPPVDRVDW